MIPKKWLVVGLSLVGLSSACIKGWFTEQSFTDQDLYAVWGVSNDEVFAVGAKGAVGYRHDGTWIQLDAGSEENLRGVWGTDAEHIVIVGDNCTVLQFDGLPEETPDGGQPQSPFRALTAETCGQFYSIDGIEQNRAFVVGEGRAQRYNGSDLVNAADCGDRMLGVSYPKEGEVFTVGEKGKFCHLHDSQWDQEEVTLCPVELVDGKCPTDPMLPILWDVWVSPGGQGVVVSNFGALWRYPPPAEGIWKPEDIKLDSELHAAHGWVDTEGQEGQFNLFAVGAYSVVLHITAEEISSQVVGTNEDLFGVWCSSDGKDVYVVGEGGRIVHYAE